MGTGKGDNDVLDELNDLDSSALSNWERTFVQSLDEQRSDQGDHFVMTDAQREKAEQIIEEHQ